ncbi:hypothetical protein ACO0R3_002098 [Hanseniaspora guilliermondii]
MIMADDTDNKAQKTVKNPENIFDYIEKNVLHSPISPFSSLDIDLLKSLEIDYPEYKPNNKTELFSINDIENLYENYDDIYTRSILSSQRESNKKQNTKHSEIDFQCEENDDVCAFNKAQYLLNKLNSTEEDKLLALHILEKIESSVPETHFLLGVLYENYGVFFNHDSTEQQKFDRNLKSLAYYRKCAEQGDSNCQLVMAHKYFLGEEVPHDTARANFLQYSVIKKEINDAQQKSRFDWSMNDHEVNLWNHNYFKFLHDPEYNTLEYVNNEKEKKSINYDSKVALYSAYENKLLSDFEFEFIDDMLFQKVLYKKKLLGEDISQYTTSLVDLGREHSLDSTYMSIYFVDELENLTHTDIMALYYDLVNVYKGHMFFTHKDYRYVFDISRKVIMYYIKNEKYVDKLLTETEVYCLDAILVMFANIYKEYGIYEEDDLAKIDLILALYKKVTSLTYKSTAFWETFKLLRYIKPHLAFNKIHENYIRKQIPGGYARIASIVYMLNDDVKKSYKEEAFDESIRKDVNLHSFLQSGLSYPPLLYESVNLDYTLSAKQHSTDQSATSSKLRALINTMQMNCNIEIFQQNFVNIMNYLLGYDSELNLFAMTQLASMGFIPAIENLANELINPINLLSDVNTNISQERLNIGISKYLISYKFGNTNLGLHLSNIFENFKMYSEMLSLNHLIANRDGTFYSFYNIAKIYEHGYGVDQDYEVAAEFYRKALDLEPIQFFHNSYKFINGLEFSIRLLLWKLKFKQMFKEYKIPVLFRNLFNTHIYLKHGIKRSLLYFAYIKNGFFSNVISIQSKYEKNLIWWTSHWTIRIIVFFILFITINYLALKYNWRININGFRGVI